MLKITLYLSWSAQYYCTGTYCIVDKVNRRRIKIVTLQGICAVCSVCVGVGVCGVVCVCVWGPSSLNGILGLIQQMWDIPEHLG